ncbi:MAG: carbonic anhydrase family protein [Pseudomonadota bacterium]
MSARTHWSILALPLALLALSSAAPAQWELVANHAGKTVEIDKNRVSQLKNGQTAAWTRLTLDHPVLDFENQVRYTAVQALNYYDCANGSFATQKRVFLLDERAIKTEKVTGASAIPARPDTLDAQLFEEVCKTRSVVQAEQRPRPMHAEMVSAGDMAAPRGVKVADAPAPAAAPVAPPAEKPRLFEMPVIDKSKAEDPYKGMTPPPAAPVAGSHAAPTPAGPAPRAAAKIVEPIMAPDLSRQQRELMLATSGPRKAAPKKKKVVEPPPPDYSHVHWGYAGMGAPENWAKIKPEYATCGTGQRQSPIDIRGGIKVDLEPIRFDYRPTHFRIMDNGHTVQVEVGEGSSITVTGRTYPLVQFHFHRPSEERIGGKAYDMVAHLVHKDYDGSLAVIAVLMERGMEHPLIQTLWNHMPLEVGMAVEPPDAVIDLNRLLPEKREYYTYMGSLTTPPCTENVLWMVFKNPVPVSSEQIGIFSRLYPNNARPVQPANDRLIKGSR